MYFYTSFHMIIISNLFYNVVCEGSKLFEVCESFLGQTASYSDEKRYEIFNKL